MRSLNFHLASILVVGAAADPTAVVKNGTLRGIHSKEWNQGFFLGIPFAQPPLGPLRFRHPQPPNSSFDGVRDAVEYGYSCYQFNSYYKMSEDCLTLNVIRPAGYENASLPVLLWIYGGGFYCADPQYNMSGIVKTAAYSGSPFIGVSINYRLGVWGFLATPEIQAEGSSNAGLLDQRMGMQWIQDHIAAFGGDPKRVTLWGESAGAQAISYHLHSYDGRDDGLYSAAILESGGTVGCQLNALPFYTVAYENLTRTVGCWTARNKLACLRDLTSTELYHSNYSLTWNPVVDGDFLTGYPASQLDPAGNFVRVPLLLGTNTDEGIGFSVRGANTSQDLFNLHLSWRNYVLSPPSLRRLLELYPDEPSSQEPSNIPANQTFSSSYGTQWRRAVTLGGDLVMHSGRRKMCEEYARGGVRNIYSYRFDTPLWNASVATLPAGGVKHFDNVMFSFQNLTGALGPLPEFQHYKDLTTAIGRAYAKFVEGYDPNGNRSERGMSPEWPSWEMNEPKNLVLRAGGEGSFVEADDWRSEGIDFINSISRELLA